MPDELANCHVGNYATTLSYILKIKLQATVNHELTNNTMKHLLPVWALPWVELITLGLQLGVILLLAMLLHAFARRLIKRLVARHSLPPELVLGGQRSITFLIYGSALLFALDRLGIPGTVLWTAISGFITVAAVAFFAAWSVLSNIFSSVLIYTTRPFRLHDHIEVVESGDKPGFSGEVLDIHLVHTTLRDTDPASAGCLLQIPNTLFFQRVVRVKPGSPSLETLPRPLANAMAQAATLPAPEPQSTTPPEP